MENDLYYGFHQTDFSLMTSTAENEAVTDVDCWVWHLNNTAVTNSSYGVIFKFPHPLKFSPSSIPELFLK